MNANEAISYPKFRWFVMVTMIIGVVAQGVIMIAPSPLIGEVAKFLNRELGFVTFAVMGLWTVSLCIAGVISGVIVDKVGIAKLYLVSSVLLIVSAVLIPLVETSLSAIIVLRIIGGIGTGPIIATMPRMAAEWFPLQERGHITGVQGMSTALGVLIGVGASPAIFGMINSWSQTMVWMAVPALIFLVFTIIMLSGPKAPELIREQHEDAQASKKDFKLALREPLPYLLILYIFLFNWLIQAINDLTPGYFAIDSPVGVGFGPMTAGKLMVLFQFAFMLGALVSGWFHDHVYKRNTRAQIMFAYIMTGVYFFVRFPGVVGDGPNPILLIILFVAAFFMGQGISPLMAFISKTYPEHITGRVGGMAMGIGLIGGVVGIGLGSTALSRTHNYQASILIVTIVAIIGFFAAMALKKPKAFTHLHDMPSEQINTSVPDSSSKAG